MGDEFGKHLKSSYPVTASPPGLGLHLDLSLIKFCEHPDLLDKFFKTVHYPYLNYSLPKLITDGYVLKIHDPYEVAMGDVATFNMISYKHLQLRINPKIFKIDDSYAAEDFEL